MRKFIIKSLVFISPFIPLFAWWEHGLARIPNSYNTKARLLAEAAPDCEVLVLGSSHGYMGINPSFFTQRGFNMANVSQTLFYDSELTARYLPRLPKLKCAVFAISYFSLEGGVLGQGAESFRCPFYHRFYHLPSERWIDNFDPGNFSMIALYGLTDSARYFKHRFKDSLAEQVETNGWYDIPLDKDHPNISDESGKARAEFHDAFMAKGNIAYNRALLVKAMRSYKNAGVVPVLITTPVFRTYRDHLDGDKYERMQEVIRGICEETGSKYFNYLDDRRFDIDDFSDNDHLDAPGAEKFSKILDREVLQPLMKDGSESRARR
jgi:hypothetical protein